ncbi:PaaD-like zinc ribbon domain-containing protein [Bounagaea algeriensis]
MTCPWCGSDDVERMAMYGPQLMTDQHRCRACRNFFGQVLKR